MTAAERKQRQRLKQERERLLAEIGLVRIPVLVHRHVIDVLIAHGQIAAVDRDDPAQVGVLLGRFLDDLLDNLAAGRDVRGDRVDELADLLGDG